MSRVFIFGIAGFCGSHLCDTLAKIGHHVDGMDLVSPRTSSAGDIMCGDALTLKSSGLEYDYVFHCAGPAGPARIKPGYALRQIMDLTSAGLDFAQRCGARFVKFSSSEVYGRSDVTLTETTPPLIHVPYDARSEYQTGFIAAEQMCFTHPHPDVQVLRLFNVVGPGQRAETGCVLPRFCQQALRGEPLTIFGDGSQRRAFMYIDDLTSFCLKLMEKWPEEKGVWNVAASQNDIEMRELASNVLNAADIKVGRVSYDQTLHANYRDSAEKHSIDTTKARSLGWEPKVGLAEIVERTLAWHKEQLTQCNPA